MKHRFATVSLAILISAFAGCGRNPTSPSVPTPQPAPPPSAPQPTYTLSGVVFAETPAGRTPMWNVSVDVTGVSQRATTGEDGRYRISGLYAGRSFVSVSGWGIERSTTPVTISADTQLDMQVQLDIQVVELPTYILSGVVFERTPTGTEPIEGVEVYCDGCGSPYGHTFVHTDANGYYSLSHTYPGINPLQIHKDGYGDPPGLPPGPSPGWSWRRPMVNGDTRFDIELVRH